LLLADNREAAKARRQAPGANSDEGHLKGSRARRRSDLEVCGRLAELLAPAARAVERELGQIVRVGLIDPVSAPARQRPSLTR